MIGQQPGGQGHEDAYPDADEGAGAQEGHELGEAPGDAAADGVQDQPGQDEGAAVEPAAQGREGEAGQEDEEGRDADDELDEERVGPGEVGLDRPEGGRDGGPGHDGQEREGEDARGQRAGMGLFHDGSPQILF